jgi:uncharacterized protein YecT (DUF1311 family)
MDLRLIVIPISDTDTATATVRLGLRLIVAFVIMSVLLVPYATAADAADQNSSPSPVRINRQCERTAVGTGALDRCVDSELTQLQVLLDSALKSEGLRFGFSVVQTVERSWITYMDANCLMEYSTYKGGSEYPSMVGFCKVQALSERILDIRKINILPRE